MNRFFAMALSVLLLAALPVLAFADAPVLLLDLPENALMVENVEFENGDFIQNYQLDAGTLVQLLRYSGFTLTLDELIASDWPVNCGVQMQELSQVSGYPAQYARIRQALDAEGYAVKADGKESGMMQIDLLIVNVEDTVLIFQSLTQGTQDSALVADLVRSLQVQGGEDAEVG